MLDPHRLHRAYLTVRDELLAERTGDGHWVGELSSSALSTATAISALALVRRHAPLSETRREEISRLVDRGLGWLAGRQNSDGGWGDTDKSLSNISTTMLACAAFQLADAADQHADRLARAAGYIDAQGGVDGLRRRYGKDRTFSVPILTNAALAGLVDWREVAPLPFELACLPPAIWGLVRMPVVSYAIPALVAIGQARFGHRPPRNPIVRWLRRRAILPTLAKLQRMQPASGGYLEATPLTSFVVMSLASVGQAEHPVTARGVEFLVNSARSDGSWPIDTNLATWTTTLAVNALAAGGEVVAPLVSTDWLLACQHVEKHPMTGAVPGGWGWTDLSGAVPDADDTPGALLALAALRPGKYPDLPERFRTAVRLGLGWLFRMQNRDGGWPTFCRGWGTMPFDRSGVDLTAHAIRALHVWRAQFQTKDHTYLHKAIHTAIERGLRYLERQQRPDGSFVPLWFGNQHHPAEENPVYGTGRVLLAYRDLGLMATEPARRGLTWLVENANDDGGWGAAAGEADCPRGVSSMEETAVAVEAMLAASGDPLVQPHLERGLEWLARSIEDKRHREVAPIGLYFARLWYYERLYPLVFCVSALGQAVRRPEVADQNPVEHALDARNRRFQR